MSVLHLNRRLVTEEVALEAVRKDAGVLYDIPQRAITPLVADTAVRGDPGMIQWVPRSFARRICASMPRPPIPSCGFTFPTK